MPTAAETHHSLCRSNYPTWALRHSLKHGEHNLPKLTLILLQYRRRMQIAMYIAVTLMCASVILSVTQAGVSHSVSYHNGDFCSLLSENKTGKKWHKPENH